MNLFVLSVNCGVFKLIEYFFVGAFAFSFVDRRNCFDVVLFMCFVFVFMYVLNVFYVFFLLIVLFVNSLCVGVVVVNVLNVLL